MDVAASAVALVEAAAACVKTAKALVDKYRAYRNANAKVGDLILRVEGVWLKTERQIELLRDISDTLDLSLLAFLQECIERLDLKLCGATAEIEKINGSSRSGGSIPVRSLNLAPLQRVRYSFMQKHLHKTIENLESWHATFDPTWLLITLPATSKIDEALQKQSDSHQNPVEATSVLAIRAVFRDPASTSSQAGAVYKAPDFLTDSRQPLVHSSLYLSTVAGTGDYVILDTTAYPSDCDLDGVVMDVRNLARILRNSDPSTLGLLRCVGVLKVLDSEGQGLKFQFIYSPPAPLANPATLRSLFFHSAPSLDVKFQIAKAMARSVTAVHSAGFVHKNIRPDTVVVFEEHGHALPAAFLVGFERFRAARSGTTLTTDMVWHRNLYRHPTRQGRKPEDIIPYIMQHDIYSLGVCLLELGLWSTFVTEDDEPKPGTVLDIAKELELTNVTKAAWDIRAILLTLAKERLPQSMGNLYADVVTSCLTCLDSGATNMFGTEQDLFDEDGILVGVAFIEKILQSLESISVGHRAE